MKRILACSLVIAAVLLAMPAGVSARPEVQEPVLGSRHFHPCIECSGWGTYKPRRIFNGGDPSGLAFAISWKGWGGRVASGYGENFIYKPQGGYYRTPVVIELRASRLGHCSVGGPLAYTHLEARVPGSPGGRLGPWLEWGDAKSICS